jgi:hypothetical protein
MSAPWAQAGWYRVHGGGDVAHWCVSPFDTICGQRVNPVTAAAGIRETQACDRCALIRAHISSTTAPPGGHARAALTPYQRIMRAAAAGRGVRLTAAECVQMSRDDAIATVAENDDRRMRGEPDHEWPFGMRMFEHGGGNGAAEQGSDSDDDA